MHQGNEAQYVCCDWGTSSLRLSWHQEDNALPIATSSDSKGILYVQQQFLSTPDHSPEARFRFFSALLMDEVNAFTRQHGIKEDVPLLISGMASANIVMQALPYASLPFAMDGSGAVTKRWAAGQRPCMMASGLRADDDIMRGEETQVLGLYASLKSTGQSPNQALVILPGTHSKHVRLEDGRITGFKTYMTGEVFCLMFNNSILAQSVKVNDMTADGCTEHFRHGVQAAQSGNILNNMFEVRIRGMFNRSNPEQNFAYLSGLLIGSELKDISGQEQVPIWICGSDDMNTAYLMALETLGMSMDRVKTIPAAHATALGQMTLFKFGGMH